MKRNSSNGSSCSKRSTSTSVLSRDAGEDLGGGLNKAKRLNDLNV